MNQEETRYAMALSCLPGVSGAVALHLYRNLGSAKAVFDHRNNIKDVMPDAAERLCEALRHWDEALRRADTEQQFATKHQVQMLSLNDPSYPDRLRQCDDAPLVIYYRGSTPLNARRAVSIVGTRHRTRYGQDLVEHFLSDLAAMCPQVLVVSGLAYGIDISAHCQALRLGLPTVGVLAHGLEKIYPAQHRDTAVKMVLQGGLVSEYMSGARMDKMNFVRRNRIVAGISDATVVVESAAKGGSLITARLAQDYNRQVAAFPGAVGATYSEGCNNLIRDNGAALITSAEDFVAMMGWQTDTMLQKAKSSGIERDFFPQLSPEEQRVVDVLDSVGDLQLNMLAVKTDISIGQLTALLFQLEMNGVIRPLAGGAYHLIK